MREEKKQFVTRLLALFLALTCALALPVLMNRSSALAAGAQNDSSALLSQAALTKDSIGGLQIGAHVDKAVSIWQQPESQTAVVGSKATFKVGANVPGTVINYQWQYRKNASCAWANSQQQGNQTDTLTVSVTAGLHGYQFRCVINDGGITPEKTTNVVMLAVRPKITTQPQNKTAAVGSSAVFTAAATGKGPIKYQWQYRKNESYAWAYSAQSGNRTDTLSVATTAGLHGYQFRCVVTDANGMHSYTSAATLSVRPGITTWPKDASVSVGSNAVFTVAATGKATLKYQWQYRKNESTAWANSGQSGCRTATLSVATTSGLNGYQFRCIITDGNGMKSYTTAATLTVRPAITSQPTDKSVTVGNTATFSVTATGKATLTYLWQYRKDPSDTWKTSGQSGNRTATLSVATTVALQGYQFRCVVTDGNGSKSYTKAATLTLHNIPINATTFPDANFRARVSGNYDKDHNGKLSASEIKAVTMIDVEEEEIRNLKGVQFFTELTYLNCGYDSIKTLNVSANKKLEILECYSCSLTSLNVCGLTKLQELDCYWNNLTTLDLSTNTALEMVHCYGNKLTKLDVSKNTALYELICHDNNITKLDLTKNVNIEYVVCDENVQVTGGGSADINHTY